jgi:pyruvate kinase
MMTTTTALKDNGMDAYEAQMRSMAAGVPPMSGLTNPYVGGSGAVVMDAPTTIAPDNFKLAQRWRKKTKQLATLGPASSSFEMIEKLFLAGADVFRLNFSHGEHAQKKELLDIIRQVEAKYEHPIAVLGDLQGPKLRVGQFANPAGEDLVTGQAFRLDLDPTPGTNQRVLLPHPEIIEASRPGHVLLVDDGKVKLQVTGTGPGYLDCVVGKSYISFGCYHA